MNDTYQAIMIKENDTSNLNKLGELLSQGYHTTEQVAVGRSTVVILRKRAERNVQARGRDLFETPLTEAVANITMTTEAGN